MKLSRVLAPIDFSEQSRIALREADEIAVEGGADLTLFHVHQIVQIAILEFSFVESGPKIAGIVEAAEKNLREWARTLRTPNEKVRILVETGQPLTEILAQSAKHDLIVMATHGRAGPSHFLLGSVAERVVRASRCSVLIVKPPRTSDALHA